MKLLKWSKKIDDMHFSSANESFSTTLCGKPMLGNNYAKVKPEDHPVCEECRLKLKSRNLK